MVLKKISPKNIPGTLGIRDPGKIHPGSGTRIHVVKNTGFQIRIRNTCSNPLVCCDADSGTFKITIRMWIGMLDKNGV
jgi:hypothetical protein